MIVTVKTHEVEGKPIRVYWFEDGTQYSNSYIFPDTEPQSVESVDIPDTETIPDDWQPRQGMWKLDNDYAVVRWLFFDLQDNLVAVHNMPMTHKEIDAYTEWIVAQNSVSIIDEWKAQPR